MAKLSLPEKEWYFDVIDSLGGAAVKCDRAANTVTYDPKIGSDESHVKSADGEELTHAVTIGLLHSTQYNYPLRAVFHELHLAHGRSGGKSDEADILVKDPDGLPYAFFELRAAHVYDQEKHDAIKNQLFGNAPLIGSPKLLAYATVEPKGPQAELKVICIDYAKFKSYDAWRDAGEPHSSKFPREYQEDLDYEPFINLGKNDLKLDSTQADFRAVALSFHNEFFGEHADNTIFLNLVKCLLAKIYDERTRKKGETYAFQVLYQAGKPESAKSVFQRINDLYKSAYKRHMDPKPHEEDEINPKEFSEERVKTVVLALQGISITKGAAKHGDIIGAFFEEILRSGFKQDRGMYFTHDNLVRFMVEVVNVPQLASTTWQKATHPENRLPHIIDPACGSGTFLLHAMDAVTRTIRSSYDELVNDHDSEQFYTARLSDSQPNYWAENFLYGFDPKFVMAITAKVNMVLHGDGSAHISKDDGLKSLSQYEDSRLRPRGKSSRSVAKSIYPLDVCENFDLVLSNPPFGITLGQDVRSKINSTYTLGDSVPSEALFIERCFQLLKENGRMGIVLPESILNAKELASVRLFIYRFFQIVAIISLPRNLFIDTPTLTSLLFARKKTGSEVKSWDDAWGSAQEKAQTLIKSASKVLAKKEAKSRSALEVSKEYLSLIYPVANSRSWVLKGGKAPTVHKFHQNWADKGGELAANYYREVMKTAAFKELTQNFIFSDVAKKLNYEFPVFIVEEVGYKLSKRRERAKPNQLCTFKGRNTGSLRTNLHLSNEECDVVVQTAEPITVLDHIRREVSWVGK